MARARHSLEHAARGSARIEGGPIVLRRLLAITWRTGLHVAAAAAEAVDLCTEARPGGPFGMMILFEQCRSWLQYSSHARKVLFLHVAHR